MKGCPFEALGLIAPIMSIPHIDNDQGAAKTLKGIGEALTLSAKAWALVALSHMDTTIVFHSAPIVPYPQNILSRGMFVGMCSKGSLMHFH